jgi:membrane protease YdiL (CAAX protease family)
MLFPQDLFPQVLPWILLVITMITAFIKPTFWLFLLGCTLVTGLFYNAINIVGIGSVIVLLAMSFYANKSSNSVIKTVITTLVIISCIALAVHFIPGFNNLLVLSDVTKSAHSVPFTMYLNFDKPLILFVLLMLYPTILLNKEDVSLFSDHHKLRLTAFVAFTFILIFSLAVFLSLIKYDPNLPSWWWLFALNNLLLTCIVEEVFFRGFIQHKLSTLMNPFVALICTSFLFGIAHFSGGFNYMIVATFAGFLYGVVYLQTGKIWPAIVIHFCLNMTHLLLFTYPLHVL